ncbi:hypothetical protein DPMN_160654 [Dreissena polymorpha]|uniref:Uncharacterized protein n=1 Tax=Dreissena polymorpha TaxID=45954 RepID=A0A9D4INY8_DREPO|nr:hypothetical protein DPMN_160654 [Dreissena polymorpha]
MDYTTTGITKEEILWLNACIALDITKEGLSSFVDNEIKLFQVAVGIGCGNCFTENLVACPTDGMCEYANSCTYHNTPALQPLKCERCELVKQNIVSNHRYRHPSWKNTKAQQWANNPWEIAKCYIPSDGYLHVSSVQETDLTGIISLLLNCLHFNKWFSFEIASPEPRNECILTRVCEIIDKVHTAGCEISEDSLQDMFHTLSTILCDPVRLKYDSNACRANTKLEQLKTGQMAIPPKYYVQYMTAKHVIEQETLQQVSEVVQKTLQRQLKSERRVAEDKIPTVFHQIIQLISIGTQKIQGLNKIRFENNVSYESDGILSVNIKRQRTEIDVNEVNSPAQSHIVIYQPISHKGDRCTTEMQTLFQKLEDQCKQQLTLKKVNMLQTQILSVQGLLWKL